MKQVFSLFLSLVFVLAALAGCGSSNDDALAAMQQQLDAMQQQLDEAEQQGYTPGVKAPAAPKPTPTPAAEEPLPLQENVLLFNAAVNGETCVPVSGEAMTAEAVIAEEGIRVDHWAVNGVHFPEETMDTFTFTADSAAAVEAVLRPEKKVTTINAEMHFLNEKGKPAGEPFTEFVFESKPYDAPYKHPLTGADVENGTVTVHVEAVVPRGYRIAYWLINDVPYYFDDTVEEFTVVDLDETTVYEVVLEEKSSSSSASKPSPTPTPKPGTLTGGSSGGNQFIVDIEKPESSPEPDTSATVYYTVTCFDCSFSGGGAGGSSGQVPAGTKISVSTDYASGTFYWTGDYSNGDNRNPSTKTSFSYTVNSDCFFQAIYIVN
ncbi:MAG: hypothetical protein E7330_00640 [Clostridiales bacterium]|nr:hypothetical protein [Clostridiales bacterium]